MKVRIEMELEEAMKIHEIIGSCCSEDIENLCVREKVCERGQAHEYDEAVDSFYRKMQSILKFRDQIMEGK